MKRISFKIISLTLVFTHLFVICFRDVSFAQESRSSPDYQSNIDFDKLGKVPDTIGHGQPPSGSSSKTYSVMAAGLSEVSNTFFQKDIHTPSDKFNRILETVSPDLFTGRAQLNIPLYLPQGKRDIVPPLNIAYSSGTGNGILGVGWSLDLGSISRSTKRGVPKYNSLDTFVVQGQELASIGNNEYRTKIEETFIKYVYNNDSWQAIDKSGRKYFFGSSSESRITTSKGTHSWALDKIIDLKGNCLTISYLKEEKFLYPQTILYTANEITGLSAKNKITFTYENRPDTSLSYIIDEQVKLLKRLKSIEVFFDNKLVRKYVFNYSQSPSIQRSLLTKVTEYGSDGITTSPQVTFTYRANTGSWSADQSKWHTPDGDFIKSAQDQGRRVYDLNGDGMFDFVISRHDPNESPDRQWLKATHLNSKDGFSPKPNWWPVPLGYFIYNTWDDGRRLVDLTGDGIPELLAATLWDPYLGSSGQYKDAYVFKYVDLVNPRWEQDTRWNLPDGYFVYGNKVDGGRRFGDLNGDGLNDLSIASEGIRWSCQPLDISPSAVNTYINTGSGWQQDQRWNSPDGCYIKSFGSSRRCDVGDIGIPGDGGRRLADINGDGLADFLVACDGYKATYLNTGSGWIRNDIFNIPDGSFAEGGKDQGRMLVDINGDGLNDLVVAKAGYHATYLNTGAGWKRDDSFNIPDGDFVDGEGKDQGRYLADLDGDGVIDICIAKDGYKKAYLNLAGSPDLLIKISNGLGGESSIEYTSSTTYENYYPNRTGKLPFAAQTVSKITLSDGQSNSYSTNYSYKDGYFDAGEREFRGFGYVKVTDAEGNYTENYFKQDSIYKGRLYKQEAKNALGNLYARTVNTWAYKQLYSGVNFVYLAQTDNFIYDGDTTYKQTQLKFEYDTYGNPIKVISYGDVDLAADDKTQITEYTYNPSDWLLVFPKHTYLQDAQTNKVSEKWFYYDNQTNINDPPTQGLLTKEEVLIFNPLTGQQANSQTQYAYDQYGNLASVTDALGRTSLTRYDSICYTYPIQVINALGHTLRTVYYGINESPDDPFTGSGLVGQVKSAQDPNNQKTYNVYDVLGRLIKVIGPNDTESYPAVIYEYDLTTQPIKITKKVKADYASPPNYLTTYQFSDGLGRLIQSKSPAENEPSTGQARQVVSGMVKFDSRGQVKEKYLPYFVNTSSNYVTPTYETPHATFSYDPLGRLIQTTQPDLTYSTVNYSDWVITTNDENGHQRKAYSDAYGRVTKIEEHNGTQIYTTSYQYDTLGNLTKVIDNQGNTTQIWYDSLGRKLKMDDPDMGIWSYEYDKVGNLIKQTDAKGQVLIFSYDALNRLTGKQGGGQTLATYSYDSTSKPYCIGRLSKVTDSSGSTEFFYDTIGREIKSVKVVDGSSYTVERTYDALDRLITLKYPDGEVLNYIYNPQGITSITSSTGQTYVSNLDYSPTGQITKIQYGNGTQTNYTYDPKTLRLNNLLTQSPSGKLQDLTYQFDKVGNIKNITDYVNTATQALLYDDLDRLIQASGSYGVFSYAYDSIGNMTYKEGINLTYGKAGKLPHAVTQYGSTIIDYDLNGNMLKKGNSELTYDVENRLKTVADKALQVSLILTLAPGWNFISFPVVFSDSKISSVLSSINGKYDQVSRYNSTTKRFEHYVKNSKYDQFSSFEFGRGYQVYITGSSNVTLTVKGSLPTSNQAIALKTGYNLTFCPKTAETAVETALSPLKLGVDYSKVLYYNKATAKFQEYSSSKKEFATLKPGVSYYLSCLKNTTWNISYSSASTTSFTYDGDGGRVKKTTASDSTTYIGSLFEKDSLGKATKHIFLGANRVCAVESTGNKYYYHSDHLGSSNVVTNGSGQQVGLTEFTPYGSTFKQTGTYNPKHKFTGKELDATTGLYFYGARYYDPQLGRFITADPIVPQPYNSQSLNRYSYCDNNPINYTDPTGHGKFKDFWKKVFNWFKDEVLQPLISFMTTLVFSGGNFVAATAAAIATAALDTGEGRQFIKRVGKEVFDDAFGMSPQWAHMISGIAIHTATSLALERVIANLVASPVGAKQFNEQSDAQYLEESQGYNPWGRNPEPFTPEKRYGGFSKEEILTLRWKSSNEVAGFLGISPKEGGLTKFGLPVLHSGATTRTFPLNKVLPSAKWSYGNLFGICHQASNATLLKSGISNVATDFAKGWEFRAATYIYGNYGGGLPQKIYQGIKYYQED